MTKRNSSTRAKEGRWFSLLQMLHRCLSLRYVPGDHHVSWLLLAWSPFSSQPVNGLLLYSKASKAYRAAIPQIFLFFSSSSSFISVLLCFHSQHLLVRCFLSTVLCIFSASRNRKVGGAWCPSISLECNRQLLTTYVASFNILGAVKLPTVPGMFDVRIPIFCYPSLSLLTRWWDKTRNGEEPVKMTHSSSPSIFPTSPVKLETLVLFPSTPYYSFM